MPTYKRPTKRKTCPACGSRNSAEPWGSVDIATTYDTIITTRFRECMDCGEEWPFSQEIEKRKFGTVLPGLLEKVQKYHRVKK